MICHFVLVGAEQVDGPISVSTVQGDAASSQPTTGVKFDVLVKQMDALSVQTQVHLVSLCALRSDLYIRNCNKISRIYKLYLKIIRGFPSLCFCVRGLEFTK